MEVCRGRWDPVPPGAGKITAEVSGDQELFGGGGTAAGRYREWLAELPSKATSPVTDAEILVLAHAGDTGHPLTVAEDWADRLGASLEVFSSPRRHPKVYQAMRRVIHRFLNEPGSGEARS